MKSWLYKALVFIRLVMLTHSACLVLKNAVVEKKKKVVVAKE